MIRNFFKPKAEGDEPAENPARKLTDDVVMQAVHKKYESLSDRVKISDQYHHSLEGLAVILHALNEQHGLKAHVVLVDETQDNAAYAQLQISGKGIRERIKKMGIKVWANEGATELVFADNLSSNKEVFFFGKKHGLDFYDANARKAFFDRIGNKLGLFKAKQSRLARAKGIVYRELNRLQSPKGGKKMKGPKNGR